jgi:hypothetical protein
MLEDLLTRAVEVGGDRIEIEHKGESRLVTAFCGSVGVGIARLDPAQWAIVFGEMKEMKKRREAVLGGKPYRLAFSRYQSFDEWVFVIRIDPDQGPNLRATEHGGTPRR